MFITYILFNQVARLNHTSPPHHACDAVGNCIHSVCLILELILCLSSHSEKQIKVSIRRENPYQSHIPYCAMFPTFHCPDDPDTGVRAASKLPINPLLPANAPQVTLLSKSKGQSTAKMP